jgi:hypothetical protein
MCVSQESLGPGQKGVFSHRVISCEPNTIFYYKNNKNRKLKKYVCTRVTYTWSDDMERKSGHIPKISQLRIACNFIRGRAHERKREFDSRFCLFFLGKKRPAGRRARVREIKKRF